MTDATTSIVLPEPHQCTKCDHLKRDHSGRQDQRQREATPVARRPWCHLCQSACDYGYPADDETAPHRLLPDRPPVSATDRKINSLAVKVQALHSRISDAEQHLANLLAWPSGPGQDTGEPPLTRSELSGILRTISALYRSSGAEIAESAKAVKRVQDLADRWGDDPNRQHALRELLSALTDGPANLGPLSAVEVRERCPYCPDGSRMIPRVSYARHLSKHHGVTLGATGRFPKRTGEDPTAPTYPHATLEP